MTTGKTGIYHWKLGDIALARLCKKVYSKVQVVKNEDGLFYDDKVLGISANEEGSITVTEELCYYVETCNTKNRFWVPYTSLHLAGRSRPFYGPADKAPKISPPKTSAVPRKRKLKEDLTMPINVKLNNQKEPDLNATYNVTHTPLKQGRNEDAFKEFTRRGKECLFDEYYNYLQRDIDINKERLDYLMNIDASTEDKFEIVTQTIASEKEIENYLHQCWRYNFVREHTDNNEDASDNSFTAIVLAKLLGRPEVGLPDARGTKRCCLCMRVSIAQPLKPTAAEATAALNLANFRAAKKFDENYKDCNSTSPVKAEITLHTPWCLVCGKGERLRECPNCPTAFHLACRKEWLVTILHRKNPPKKDTKPVTLIEKILSSTRTISSVRKDKENIELCPSCMWGPAVGYDDVVWHKLGPCPWWPARVLTPGAVPSCLLATRHSPHQWPLKYYGTLNHSWGEASRMTLFIPSHANTTPRDEMLAKAMLDACDDYISVYLT